MAMNWMSGRCAGRRRVRCVAAGRQRDGCHRTEDIQAMAGWMTRRRGFDSCRSCAQSFSSFTFALCSLFLFSSTRASRAAPSTASTATLNLTLSALPTTALPQPFPLPRD